MSLLDRLSASSSPLVPRVRRRVRATAGRWNPLEPGKPNALAQSLDQRAARRVLQALVRRTRDVETVRWLGRHIWQFPLDTWIVQEVISESKPDLIVETGTHRGGSAFFYASLLDQLGHGEIITIDVAAVDTIPHDRITYISGSSVDPLVVAGVRERAAATPSGQILVILDSDHDAAHVSAELEAYADLVPVGSYIHVQDGCIDELAIFGKRPGPRAAAESFLREHPDFVRDLELERRYVMTAHPYGWLRRVGATPA